MLEMRAAADRTMTFAWRRGRARSSGRVINGGCRTDGSRRRLEKAC
jgi:hypothetical protein